MRDTETVTVFVDEGTVAVSSPNERILLHAGSSITLTEGAASPVTEMEPREEELLDELLSGENAAGRHDTDTIDFSDPPDAGVPDRRPPSNRRTRVSAHKDVDAWRALILDGEVQKAETRIKRYLRGNPRDMEAAMLSAVCEKKQGRYGEAAETYKRVAASGNTKYANTARYLAAELKQSRLGHFQEAVELLDDYLVNAPKSAPNRAEARFRKAECLLAMGESARAWRILTELIEDYGRAPIANRARTLRESIDMGRDPMR
jgi:tetratricopeptide (TPR) repeat protein